MPGTPRGQPTVDVLISTFNEEAYIAECLDSVLCQDYPPELVQIWVIDGGSTDSTVSIVTARAAGEPRIRVIADGARMNLPEALNVGIEHSSGDLVAKIDARTFPARDFLTNAVAAFQSEDGSVACVGGRPEQHGETRFGQALALARTSRFGVGASEYAGTRTRTVVDSVQCGVYLRGPLDAVGRFDPGMPYGEDEELNWRLRRSRYDVLLDTSIRFRYVTRPSWTAAYRQYRNYGVARTRVLARHPDFLRAHHLVPAAAVATVATLTALAPVSRAARRALGALVLAYAAGACAAADRAAAGDRQRAAGIVAAFTALHAGYGVGMLAGLVRWRPLRREEVNS